MHLTIIEVETDDNKNFFAILSFRYEEEKIEKSASVPKRVHARICDTLYLLIAYIFTHCSTFCVYLVLKHFEVVLAGDVFSISKTQCQKKKEKGKLKIIFLTVKKNVLQLHFLN